MATKAYWNADDLTALGVPSDDQPVLPSRQPIKTPPDVKLK
jgi:hypothetical protein